MKARRVEGLAGLRALRDDWRSLHAGADLYARYEWHLALALHWLEDGDLAYLQVLDGERTLAILPMISASMTLAPFGRLRALSFGLREELADFPLAPGVRIEEVAAAVRAALDRWPARWDVLRWPRALASSNVARLTAAFDPAMCRVSPEEACNVLDTRRPAREVRQGWSKNLGASLARSRKRLAESGGMRVTSTGDNESPEEIAGAYETFLDLEASGWKAAAGSAIRMVPQQKGFLAELLALRSADFSPEVILLWRGDKPIAGEYGVTVNGCQHLFKMGYDESEKRYGPGNVLMAAIVEAACEKGLPRVNLVTDAEWHPAWNPVAEASVEIVVFRARWRALLYRALSAFRRIMRK